MVQNINRPRRLAPGAADRSVAIHHSAWEQVNPLLVSEPPRTSLVARDILAELLIGVDGDLYAAILLPPVVRIV